MREAEVAAFARGQIANGSQSFAAAARLFDPKTRDDVMLLYAWCRHCDDVVDGQTLGHESEVTATGSPLARLRELEAMTHRAFAGEPVAEPAFRALQLVAARRRLPERLALDHLEGFRMDAEGRAYRTVEDLLDYCHHVAGVVGVMMARIMGASDAATLDRAADLGLAFQLTNIARDIVPDAKAGRVYLPEEWLDAADLAPDAVDDPETRPKVADLARRLIELAEPYYVSARIGIDALPRRSAWAIATALGVYRDIGIMVVERGADAWDTRVSTGRSRKLRHVARAGAAAFGRRASPVELERPPTLWTHPA